LLRVAVATVLSLAVSFAQAPGANSEPPRFEVASIRPSSPEEIAAGWSGISSGNGRTTALNVTLKGTVAESYEIREDRVLGGPAWIGSDRYHIMAKSDVPAGKETAGTATARTAAAREGVGKDAVDAMLRTLLAERFNLKLHRETRVGEVLILGVAKGVTKAGMKLHRAADGPSSYHNGHGVLEAPNITMNQLAEILSHDLRIEVVDRTGLKGAFNFTVRWNADAPTTGDRIDAAAELRWQISTAIAQQLGLTLKPQRMQVKVLVIDHAERPTEN
jgi:uncharacterized protein (TIGR03435 family)